MKFLEAGLKNIAVMGFRPNHSQLNVKFLLATFFIVLNAALNLGFLLIEAQTFLEYTNSIFMTLTTAMIAACFAILAYKINNLFSKLKTAEEITEASE